MKLSIEIATLFDMEIRGKEGDMLPEENMEHVAHILALCLYLDQIHELQEALEKELEAHASRS